MNRRAGLRRASNTSGLALPRTRMQAAAVLGSAGIVLFVLAPIA
jgi:hypothetical protein